MFSKTLLTWYDSHKRDLPWRRSNNPYHIWVSEVMLQQTQVETVIPYYNRFLDTLPHIEDLANCSDEVLLKLWEGLGYYRRAYHLKDAAKAIVKMGVFPSTYQELIKLKGIGMYTAGAILSIAFNQKHIAPDGNVYRILSRYFYIKDDIKLTATKNKLHALNYSLLTKPYGDFNQALMDFGSLVCRKDPLCEVCPLSSGCISYQKGDVKNIPYISPNKAKEEHHFYTFVLKEDGKYIYTQSTTNLLKGLYTYPQIESDSLNYALEQLFLNGIDVTHMYDEASYRHVFTHKVWHMKVIYGYATSKGFILEKEGILPMPTAHKKITLK